MANTSDGTGYQTRSGISVATELVDFVENDALPGTGVGVDNFWAGLATLVHEFGPRNRSLLSKREELQGKIKEAFATFEWSGSSLEAEFSKSGEAQFVPITFKKEWEVIRKIDDANGVEYTCQ